MFSPLGESRYALGVETIYEGYLLHYGRPRLFSPEDQDTAPLLGDYLDAHGFVPIEEAGTVEAVSDLSDPRLRVPARRRDRRRRAGVGGYCRGPWPRPTG